jgi:pyrimidine operon attenuation protein/uracil phosphoribosyltransferase
MKAAPRIKQVIAADKVGRAVKDLASYALGKFDFSNDETAIVGIQSRGVVLANRLAFAVKKEKGVDVPTGALDITLYRDDFSTAGIHPVVGETHLDFDIDNKQIIMVDDVLFTGRTIRAAIDQLMDFGRPKSIHLLVLIDRGHREMPIAAEFSAITLPTSRFESVNLRLEEVDQKDEIVVCDPVDQ